MAATNEQKLKILHVLRILWTKTDVERGVTMNDIIGELAVVGIDAERKSIYRDIEAIKEFGLEVTKYPTTPPQYAIVKQDLKFNDLMMLVDAVQGSKFLSEDKSKKLSAAIKGLASEREQKLFDKRVHVPCRVKKQSESVFRNVDTIHQAIAEKKKIEFQYCQYGADMKPHAKRGGRLYVETPVKVAFVNGEYYLAAWDDESSKIKTFRIDRMQLLQVSPDKATRNKEITDYALIDFENQAFEMYDGEPKSVTLRAKESAMNIIIDRFGFDITVKPLGGDECEVRLKVRLSKLFFGWLASMSDIIQVVGPASTVKEYRAWLSDVVKAYEQ